jgi:hypothetical protein
MNMSAILLMASFLLSLVALFAFIASMTNGLFGSTDAGSHVIFAPGEENATEDPAASRAERASLQLAVDPAKNVEMSSPDLIARERADRSSAAPVLGIAGTLQVKGGTYNGAMPPFATLSDAEIAAVLTYVLSPFGNSAPPVSASDVVAGRAATKSRTAPFANAEELKQAGTL